MYGSTSKKTKQKLTAAQICTRFDFHKGKRSTWENHWQEIGTYIVPNRGDITVKNEQGSKKNLAVLDNTGIQSCELLAGALHGMLTSPNGYFFELTTGFAEIDNLDEVRKWMQTTAVTLHNILNNSNFQTEVHSYYLDLVAYGTACLSIEEDEDYVVRFAARHLKEIYVSENNKGAIDEVYREYCWNVRQIVQEFGMEVLAKSRSLEAAWKAQTDEEFKVVHAVYPRDVTDTTTGNPRKYISQYVLYSDTKVELASGFFRDNPFVVSRWTKSSGETYGRSPGMNALPDVKTINKMTETTLKGAEKTVDPPLQLPDDGFVLPLDTRPAGLNYYRAGSSDRVEPIFNDARIDFGFQALNERRVRIRESFYVDQLQLQQGPQMTATEVLQRTEEKMRLLGPMLGRQNSEFLRPLITRVFDIAYRRRLISQPPEILQGRNLDVTYSSMIAKAQRINEAQNIQRTMQAVAPFVTADQATLDNFDGDAAVRTIAKMYGFPQEMLRDKRKVDEIRKSRAEAQEAALNEQQQNQQVDNASKILPAAAKYKQAQEVA